MILVSVGTDVHPFDRLVAAVDAWAAGSGEEVIVQWGTSTVSLRHADGFAYCAPSQLRHLAERARMVVVHAGPGSLFLAEEAGHQPIVVPRDPRLGEHVDDHQRRFARWLGPRARVVWRINELPSLLDGPGVAAAGSAERGAQTSVRFSRAFGELVDELLARRRGDRR